jgi:hypothetical protein
LVIWPKVKCVEVMWPKVRRYYKYYKLSRSRPGTSPAVRASRALVFLLCLYIRAAEQGLRV